MQLTRKTGQILLALAVGVVIGTGYGVWVGAGLGRNERVGWSLPLGTTYETPPPTPLVYTNTKFGYTLTLPPQTEVQWIHPKDAAVPLEEANTSRPPESSSAVHISNTTRGVSVYLHVWTPQSRRVMRAHIDEPAQTKSLKAFAQDAAEDEVGYETGYAEEQSAQTFRNITWKGLDAYEALWGWEPDTETEADARTRMLFFEKDGVKYELQYTNNPETRDIVNSFTFVSRPHAAPRP